ncbi:RagB/SusD family nutrient uptake outer membrane protein [Gracilimonas mengyeensis]|uniref:RagB/SusD domain-containing protein n=1 Tax=Gracilimonas mengyeensis TaxID=1302730 RepID=A0A521EGN8_9BACT|nr:RagB/SusD family nutrient uptake outer membrane protein [Gracilimonas mengyeensis]SMO83075.1 RagB/SusD domain-containing protein [Gracilimonas mengyeensis]
MKYLSKLFLAALLIAGISACDFLDPEPISDPNNPSVEGVLNNASKAQLQNLVTGLEFRHRASTGANNIMSTFGREIYPLFGSDPRFIEQWIGTAASADAENDPTFFGSAGTYTTPYRAVLQGNVLIESANNTDAITDQERNGYLGFAKTIQAYQYLIPLNTQYSNGIRFEVSDIENLGPFLGYDEALTEINNLLDEGLSDLNAAGGSFAFSLTTGLEQFNTPSTMADLNRAIAARVAIYQEDWDAAQQAVEDAAPFFELAEGADVMNKGGYFVYGDPPDIFNPFYYVPNTSSTQLPMAHPSLIDDAEEGDLRIENKIFVREEAVALQGLSSLYQDGRFEGTGDSFPFFRNEELILIYAEALAQQNDLPGAIDAINTIRGTWGLDDFASTSQAEVIDQILHERRYSLWFEGGHRWVDMRRYDRLDELPLDGGKIYNYIERPLSEQ